MFIVPMIRTKWNFQKPHANFAHYATAKRFAQQREAYSATPFAQAIVPTPSSILFTQTTSKIGSGLMKSGDFFFDLFEYLVYGPLAGLAHIVPHWSWESYDVSVIFYRLKRVHRRRVIMVDGQPEIILPRQEVQDNMVEVVFKRQVRGPYGGYLVASIN